MSSSMIRGRYKIQKRLSNKGSRQTFLALDLETQQPVVLKVLLFGHDFQWQDHKLFERGANALSTLSHPRIPRYLDYFDLDTDKAKGFVQVQSYIPARSLQQHLEAGWTFSEQEIRQLAKNLLDILIYLHNHQPAIIHRDIKPSNILLGDRMSDRVGEVFLVDFDSVQTHDSIQLGKTMTIVGTYGYMPPEQFGGKAYPASDLYSLGATLIAIATGKPPSDLPQKNLRIDFEGETQLSFEFTHWIKWLLEPSLDLRLSSARYARQLLDDPSLAPERLQKPLPAIEKPDDSRIILRQHQNTLHLILPAPGLSQESLIEKIGVIIFFLMGLSGFFNSLLSIIFWISAAFSGEFVSFFLMLLILPLLGIVSIMWMLPLLSCLLWETHLEINPTNIVMYHSMIVKINRKKSPRCDLLEIQPEKTDDGNQLLLIVRDRTFKIPTTNQQETVWLARELHRWLKVPIHKD
ncbi:MAG: serine/threonine protein kinase [Spirulina sp.]